MAESADKEQRRDPVSSAERRIHDALIGAVTGGDVVRRKVPVVDIYRTLNRRKWWRTLLLRISPARFDFAVFNQSEERVKSVLDIRWGKKGSRVSGAYVKRWLCDKAGLRLLKVPVKPEYNIEQLRYAVYLDRAGAHKVPKGVPDRDDEGRHTGGAGQLVKISIGLAACGLAWLIFSATLGDVVKFLETAGNADTPATSTGENAPRPVPRIDPATPPPGHVLHPACRPESYRMVDCANARARGERFVKE